FPTTAGAFQTAFGGFMDAFVAKLNAAGNALVYSTYLGGSGLEVGNDIAVDSSGNAYLSGFAISTDFPTTAGAFQTAFGGFIDAFVAKLNAAGNALVYSTYLGGSGSEDGFRIAIDASGNAYVTGFTESFDFPTANPFQESLAGGRDVFVTKLNPAGSALIYSTYLGGSNEDGGMGIAVDLSGNAYVTGFTFSADFPTASPLQSSLGSSQDAFVTKLNPAGSVLIYSTYLGGSREDSGNGIAVDSSGNAYVTGGTLSPNFLTTPGVFQGTFGGGADAFVAKITDVTTVPFAAFTAKAEIEFGPLANDDELEVKATFTLGTGSDRIDPLTEDVSFQVGTFSTTIPAGSFKFHPAVPGKKGKPGKPARWTFEGVIDGVELEAKITDLGGGSFEFKAEGQGADLTGTVNPVDVALTIGDDSGSTTVEAEFE
ncbi:MAG: SBBP repeat-containing protein, partial [Deltaproteobacteria bacterium]|nr:SBBP repeat-containing protein [Deltaproteobacteria bacterium]